MELNDKHETCLFKLTLVEFGFHLQTANETMFDNRTCLIVGPVWSSDLSDSRTCLIVRLHGQFSLKTEDMCILSFGRSPTFAQTIINRMCHWNIFLNYANSAQWAIPGNKATFVLIKKFLQKISLYNYILRSHGFFPIFSIKIDRFVHKKTSSPLSSPHVHPRFTP